jgi:hypothetical protein
MAGPEEEVGGRKFKKSFASRIATIILKLLIWAKFRALEVLLSLQLGLKKWGMVPKERIEDYGLTSCYEGFKKDGRRHSTLKGLLIKNYDFAEGPNKN